MAQNKRKQSEKQTTAVPSVLKDRHRAVRSQMRKRELDALIVNNAADVRYLINLPGDDSYVLITARQIYVISDSRYEELLKSVNTWGRLVMRAGSMAQRVGELLSDLKSVKRIGLQAEYLTVQARRDLSKAIGAKKCKDTVGLLSEIRSIKDKTEVKAIVRAVRIAQDALTATLADLRIGQSELEVSARLKYEMELRGASGPSFPPIVAAGANGSMPHYYPSARAKIRANKPLLIDWGAVFDGYCSDLTRTYGVGKMSRKVDEIYRIVLEAQLASIDAIRPGVSCRSVDIAARSIIEKAGYGEMFGHGLGHGIGLDVHEAPGLSHRVPEKDTLRPGMVVTVEPGIYLPGVGGVRIEDDVLVTETGHRVLSDYPKSPEDAILRG